MNKFIQMYKSIQRKKYFKNTENYTSGYAFVGAGSHSIHNLYPCLHHLGVQLKCICTKNKSSAQSMANLFTGCTATDKLEDILHDESIKGVFVCIQSDKQVNIVKQLLENNKHVFVEKPIGYSLAELKEVIAVENGHICQVGLQRRFSVVCQVLQKINKHPLSYNYRFLVGGYPEGNELYDLFIHPVDLVLQLFGKATVENISTAGDGRKKTFFITLNHGGVKGVLELSTNHTWQQLVDEISITSFSKIITARYPNHVSAIIKSPSPLNIPFEKISKQPLKQEIYLDSSNFSPLAELNSLNLQGFYPELKHFADAVENTKQDQFCRAESLLPAYEILEQLQKLAV